MQTNGVQMKLIIILSAFLLAPYVLAQVNATGTISGQVTDASGAALPGAQVKVTATGFGSAVRKDLTLQIQQVLQQDFKLQVGGVQQEVTVQAGAPLVNTESTEVGNVITQTS